MAFNLERYLVDRKNIVDQKLSEFLSAHASSETKLHESMHYSLLGGGKRLRPTLCIASGEALGYPVEKTLPVACAIEMIHTYSLIHDDLPAMDDDAIRRGRPTNHSVFGEALAILTGDALLTDAFFLMADAGLSDEIGSALMLDVMRSVSRAAGSRGMAGGQALDLLLEGREDVTLELVEKVHSLKTGALIEASVLSGARMGKADEDELSRFKLYAQCLGLSYQIIDDVLDVEGGAETGKTRGTDARKKKATYPGLFGLGRSKELAQELTEKAVLALQEFDERAEPLRQIALYLGGRRY